MLLIVMGNETVAVRECFGVLELNLGFYGPCSVLWEGKGFGFEDCRYANFISLLVATLFSLLRRYFSRQRRLLWCGYKLDVFVCLMGWW